MFGAHKKNVVDGMPIVSIVLRVDHVGAIIKWVRSIITNFGVAVATFSGTNPFLQNERNQIQFGFGHRRQFVKGGLFVGIVPIHYAGFFSKLFQSPTYPNLAKNSFTVFGLHISFSILAQVEEKYAADVMPA